MPTPQRWRSPRSENRTNKSRGRACTGRAGRYMTGAKRCKDCANIVVPILRSGILAAKFCQENRHAEVAAVFERSIYLRSKEMFLCIGEPAIGNGPLRLIADFGVSRPFATL